MANRFLKDVRDAVVARGATKTVYSVKEEKHVQVPMSKEEVENVLRMSFEAMGDFLSNNEKLYLIGFLNLEPKDYKPKNSKHPQHQTDMVIPGYRGILSKPSDPLKAKLAAGYKRDN